MTGRAAPDARALALWVAAVVTIALASDDPAARAVCLASALLLLLRRRRGDARLRPLFTLVAVAAVASVVLNTLLSHTGATVLIGIPGWLPGVGGPLTLEAVLFGVDIALGLAACCMAAATLAQLTEPEALAGALPGPLRQTGAALGAALTLAPRLAAGVRTVREAQAMRGWRPRGVRSWAAVVVPAVLTAVEGSLQLAEAMEARGYGPGRRTRYRPSRTGPADALLGGTGVLAIGLFVAAVIGGGAPTWYPYPVPTVPHASPLAYAACALLLLPALIG